MEILCWVLKAIVAIFFMLFGLPCIFAFVLGLIAFVVCYILESAEARKAKLLEDNQFCTAWESNKPNLKKWTNASLGKEIYEYQLSKLTRRELLQWIKDSQPRN